jgi:xanthine/CO dehydrogenase XdhC/CoxF family maturation factor
VGSKLLINEKGEMVGSVSGGCVESAVALDAATVIASGAPILLHYGFTADHAFEVGLPCGGEIDVFVEPGPFDAPDADVASHGSILFTVLDGPEIGRKLLVGPDGVIAGDLPRALGELAPSVRRSGIVRRARFDDRVADDLRRSPRRVGDLCARPERRRASSRLAQSGALRVRRRRRDSRHRPCS